MNVVSKNIDVVAWFAKDGFPRPVRLRLPSENESHVIIKVIKIHHIMQKKTINKPMIIFICQGDIDGIKILFDLSYELLNCKWEVVRTY